MPPSPTSKRSVGASSPDRKSTRLNSSHGSISYAVFCLKKKRRRSIARPRPKQSGGSRSCRRRPPGCFSRRSWSGSPLRAFLFFNDTATTEIYTLSLHDALPIFQRLAIPLTPRPKAVRPRRLPADSSREDRKSTRLNSSHGSISYAVFCLKKKNETFLALHLGAHQITHHLV